MRRRYRFVDEFREVLRTFAYMSEDLRASGLIKGDCDDVSIFFASGALALGYPVRFVAIRTEQDNPSFTHVYTEVNDRGAWRRFDPTVPADVVDGEVDFGRIIQGV